MTRNDISKFNDEAIRNHFITDDTHFLGIDSDRLFTLCWEVFDLTGDIHGMLDALNSIGAQNGARKIVRSCIATICEQALCELAATDWDYDELEEDDQGFLEAAEELLAGIFHFGERLDTGWEPIPYFDSIPA